MILYLSMVLVVPVLYIAFRNNEHRDRIVLITVCSYMFILLALRKPFSDVITYAGEYEYLKSFTFGEIIKDFHFIKAGSLTGMEWGFEFLCWVFSKLLHLPFQCFLVCEAAFCVFCVYRLIGKNSVCLPLSIALVICFGFFDYCFIILRQTTALGFLMLSIEQVKKRSIPGFLAMVVAAFMMHRSSMVFLAVYPLSYIPVNRKTVVIYCALSLSLLFLYPVVSRTILKVVFEKMQRDGYLVIATEFRFKEMLLGLFAIALFLVFFADPKKELDIRDRVSYWAFMVALPIEALGAYVQILSRVSTLTFLPFAAIAIPNLLETNENRKLVRIFEVLIFCAGLAYYAYCLLYDKRELEIIPYGLFFRN